MSRIVAVLAALALSACAGEPNWNGVAAGAAIAAPPPIYFSPPPPMQAAPTMVYCHRYGRQGVLCR